MANVVIMDHRLRRQAIKSEIKLTFYEGMARAMPLLFGNGFTRSC